MDSIVKQLKQTQFTKRKSITMLLKENVDIIEYYLLYKYF